MNAVGGGTARPIMYLTCATPGLSLPAGIYWLTYSLDGTGTSGPWTPPVTIDGVLATGNALQFTTAWGPALDGTYQQDFPFLIEGTQGGGGGGGIPDNFIGYNLYRDADNIAYIPYNGEDTTHYFDYDLEPLVLRIRRISCLRPDSLRIPGRNCRVYVGRYFRRLC